MGRKIILLLLCIAVVCGSACSRQKAIAGQKDLQEKLTAAIEKKRETDARVTLRLKDLTTFEWDRFYAFAPYTQPDYICQTLGFNWDNVKESSISNQDYDFLLVFVKDGKVVHFHDHPREHGTFYDVVGQTGYTPDEAVFEVTMDQSLAVRKITVPSALRAQ